jgi:hypothetical protein
MQVVAGSTPPADNPVAMQVTQLEQAFAAPRRRAIRG